MTEATRTQPSDEASGEEIADWEALLAVAEASGPDALTAFVRLLKRRFPRGHRLIKAAQAALVELERLENEKSDRLVQRSGPRPR